MTYNNFEKILVVKVFAIAFETSWEAIGFCIRYEQYR